ncbi:MAG: hypothetical protein H6696_08410 [Deferribacteres bacterium]|nr:hypothetical protein [candidate division KSB1 bacterium]MCB9501945.1 hypothetical protein [Deferribacteres bacterium]
MVLKASLSFALFLFIIQNLAGVPYNETVMNSVFYFILAFALGLGIDTLYRHIRVRIKLIEEEERKNSDEEEAKIEDISRAKASAISKLFN